VDVEHFGFLSSVIRKRESHEQDGETLGANGALSIRRVGRISDSEAVSTSPNAPAAGDPAMAFNSSIG
jgi:hypothetical protein